MKLSIKLKTSDNSEKGHPVILEISHQKKRKRVVLFHSKKNHWDEDNKLIKDSHPEYSTNIVELLNVKQKIRTIDTRFEDDVLKVYNKIFVKPEKANTDYPEIISYDFYEFVELYKNEKLNLGKDGTFRWYEDGTNKLKSLYPNLSFSEIDYTKMNNFQLYMETQGLSKSTMNDYLRAVRAIYNEGCRRLAIPNSSPFNGVKYLTIKYNRNKKKYVTKSDLKKILNYRYRNKSTDMFMLSFFLGGMNLKDIYYLKENQIHNGRLYMNRDKIDDGYEFDLKIFPEAEKIINYYAKPTEDGYLFDWKKPHANYKNFLNTRIRNLKSCQKNTEIEVLPKGGSLSMQVARHTFSTIGVEMGIDRDVKKILMGHEIHDIQSAYEYYNQDIRDEAHEKIITL